MPRGGGLVVIALGETLDTAGIVDALPIQIERPPRCAPVRPEHDPAAIGRPHRLPVDGGIDREARQRVARPLVHPHIRLPPIADLHRPVGGRLEKSVGCVQFAACGVQQRHLSRAIHPFNGLSVLRARVWQIHRGAVFRYRKRCCAGQEAEYGPCARAWVGRHAFQHRHRRTARRQSAEVERCREQRVVVDVDQMAAGQIPTEVATALHDLTRPVRQRLHDEVRLIEPGNVAVAGVEDRLPAGQHLRPTLRDFAVAEGHQWLGLPAGVGHAEQRIVRPLQRRSSRPRPRHRRDH